MAGNQRIFCEVWSVRKELFWDRAEEKLSPEIVIERAINFGGFDFVRKVKVKYGIKTFVEVLMRNRNLRKRAVNYWCFVLGFDRKKTAVFQDSFTIWSPYK